MTSWIDTPLGRRVLVVEDQAAIAIAVAAALETEGAQVVGPVATAASALEILATQPDIDAAILDVKLPDGMVFPVADELQRRNIPFVFASAYGSEPIPDRFAAVPMLDKPVSVDRIAQAIVRHAVQQQHWPAPALTAS